eukprot:GILJ01023435.1.p1 GENE.GILJ01023435.1~~GILJ01023435.1.p1  ORF type:complete len:154 (-),score=17.15 GILJ01023435.1:28-489(-)
MLNGGYSGFTVCDTDQLNIVLHCADISTKLLVRCKGCSALIGEIFQGALRAKLTALHFVESTELVPSQLHKKVDVLGLDDGDDEDDYDRLKKKKVQPIQKSTIQSNAIRNKKRSEQFLEYSDDESVESDDSNPTHRRPKEYDVEIYSDDNDGD